MGKNGAEVGGDPSSRAPLFVGRGSLLPTALVGSFGWTDYGYNVWQEPPADGLSHARGLS